MTSPDECARKVLETVPMVMRAIRKEMRSHRESDLSVPQFRVLIYLNRNEGASLSDVADHLGLSLPAMSKMVGGLVDRNLVSRRINKGDRRYVILAPTERGRTLMRAVYDTTRSRLAERLAALPASGRTTVFRAMSALESIFAYDPKTETELEK